ncbi:MAG: choice-of-anchor D domain-containing protein, partial [Phycisphaerales bacterium]|nr:choice-of-anchor D domain-containing protein [Phycisphaerales bacterium]
RSTLHLYNISTSGDPFSVEFGEPEPRDFDWPQFSETDNNMSVLITSAMIQGSDLAEGDLIGLFTDSGICAGFGAVSDEGFPVGLAAWGDDAGTEGEVEGFVEGQQLNFRLWDMARGAEFQASAEFVSGSENYVVNGFAEVRLTSSRRLSPSGLNAGGHFQYTETDQNHSLLIESALLDDADLSVGSEVGLFTPGGVCGGGMVVEEAGAQLGLAAWGDDAGTGEVDGFAEGQGFTFRYWDANSGAEYAATASFIQGPQGFVNNGFSILTLSGVTVEPEQPGAGMSLEPGATVDIRLFFTPTEVAESFGAATVETDDPYNPGAEASLHGTGILTPPALNLSASAYDFGGVLVGESRDWTFTLSNSGQQVLDINQIAVDGAYYSLGNGGGFSLSQGESTDLTVTFAPEDAGQFDGTVTIVSNDPDGDVFVNLTGLGLWFPVVGLDPADVEFGEIPLGSTGEQTLTVRNDGRATMRLYNVSTSGAPFSVEFGEGEAREFDWAQFTETDNNMSLLVSDASIRGEGLVEGDVIGVFAPGGLCAGYAAVTAEGFPVGFAAWGDDANTEETIEGFRTGEALSFRLWDISAGREWSADADFAQGAGAYTVNGFGLLSLESSARLSPGGLNAGEHFQYAETDQNHSLLITSALLDDADLSVGSEVGIFTPEGLCGGAIVIETAGEALGLAAWGDDANSEEIDGFTGGQAFTFRYYDANSGAEYAASASFTEGPQGFLNNGFTIATLSGTTFVPEEEEPAGEMSLEPGASV